MGIPLVMKNEITAPIKIGRAESPQQITENLNPSVIYINQNVLRVGREHAYIGFDKEENNWYIDLVRVLIPFTNNMC